MKKFRTLVEQKLHENNLTQKWLLDTLLKNGFNLDKTELSRAVTGSRKEPKSERILDAALDYIKEHELREFERLKEKFNNGG